MKTLLKRMLVFVVIGLVSLPAPSAFALTLTNSAFEDVVANVANAESVDFNLSVDVETYNDDLARPMQLHVDVDGATDFTQNGVFDLYFWSTDQHNAFQEAGGSLIMTPDTVYLAEDGGEWVFIEKTASSYAPSADDTEEGIAAFTAFMQEALDRGIVTYDLEGVDVIGGKRVVRVAYALDNDRLIRYLVDEDMLSEDEAEEARVTFADVTVGGYLWVDTAAMLPVMFTLNVNASPSETAYTNVEFSILFDSFNEPVEIDEPEDAVSIDEHRSGATEDMVMSSIENTVANMDTDGDGLTDEDEASIWNSNPLRADSDADGYADATEVTHGYDPNGTGMLDSDADGLSDYNEMTIHWTDRFDADSDNDGYNDGLEIANGYDPNGPGRW